MEVSSMDRNAIKFTPKDIVGRLNEYIVGQEEAKKKSCHCVEK